jgi:hypothetical protein
MMELLCRIQDSEGRGPYKPGFSHKWSERDCGAEPIYIAFPDVLKECHALVAAHGGACGCAFRNTEQASKWFSDNEVLTLATLGYALVWFEPTKILAENSDQLVFWIDMPIATAVIQKGWRDPSKTPPPQKRGR